MNDGNQYLLARPDHGPAVTLSVQKINPRESGNKTQLTLQKDGNSWRLDKLFIEGDANGYQFSDQK
jgi:hypothetical protein